MWTRQLKRISFILQIKEECGMFQRTGSMKTISVAATETRCLGKSVSLRVNMEKRTGRK